MKGKEQWNREGWKNKRDKAKTMTNREKTVEIDVSKNKREPDEGLTKREMQTTEAGGCKRIEKGRRQRGLCRDTEICSSRYGDLKKQRSTDTNRQTNVLR